MIDMEKVIQGLEHCRLMCEGVSHNPCQGCLYHGKYDCADTLKTDALSMLKEQPEIVRCKDCKYLSSERINDFNKCRRWINVGVKNFATMGDWFCADGERK